MRLTGQRKRLWILEEGKLQQKIIQLKTFENSIPTYIYHAFFITEETKTGKIIFEFYMKTRLSIFIFLGFFLTLSANAEHYKLDLEDFEILEIRIPGSVEWSSGPASGTIDCSGAVMEIFEAEQNGKKLTLQWKNHGSPDWKFGNGKIKIRLNSEMLKKVVVSGSADLVFKSTNKVPQFSMNISGSGDFSGNIECSENAVFNISGSGNIVTSGKCQSLQLSIAGSGDFQGLELKSAKTKVSISGSGDAKINAENELDVSISGSGEIVYTGNPAKVKQTISGSGEIKKLEPLEAK